MMGIASLHPSYGPCGISETSSVSVARNQHCNKANTMNTPPIKMCDVYLLSADSSVLIMGFNYESTGPGGLASSFLSRISQDAVGSLLGPLTIHTLNQTKIVDGKFYNEKPAEVLFNIAGVKSHRALASKSKCVCVSWNNDDYIEIIPTKQEMIGNSAGHSFLYELSAKCAPEPDALRDLLLAKLQDCQ